MSIDVSVTVVLHRNSCFCTGFNIMCDIHSSGIELENLLIMSET